jgi:hypothetical protein
MKKFGIYDKKISYLKPLSFGTIQYDTKKYSLRARSIKYSFAKYGISREDICKNITRLKIIRKVFLVSNLKIFMMKLTLWCGKNQKRINLSRFYKDHTSLLKIALFDIS